MRLSLSLGYQTPSTTPADHLALAQEADRLGYAAVWASEAYGSDAATMLSWIAGQTSRIDLGSAVFQIPARSPAMTAMTAATLDTLSGGRFRLGLGVSGPQVSEGWYGVPFGRPVSRTREYVEIVRAALARKTVRHEGREYAIPLEGAKPLKLLAKPVQERIPVYLGAVGPRVEWPADPNQEGWTWHSPPSRENPRRVNSSIRRTTSVVLPDFFQPAMPMTGVLPAARVMACPS